MNTLSVRMTSQASLWNTDRVEECLALIEAFRSARGLIPEEQYHASSGHRRSTLGVFSAALIGHILGGVPEHLGAGRLHHDLANALLEARNRDGTWSFEGPDGSYPADVDDTALALSATHVVRDARDDLRRVLRAARFSTSGLARTWFKSRFHGGWNAVDPVVNLHLLAALRRVGLPAERLAGSVRRALPLRPSITPYYCSSVPMAAAARDAFPTGSPFYGDMSPADRDPRVPLFRQRRAEIYYNSPALCAAYEIVDMVQASHRVWRAEVA